MLLKALQILWYLFQLWIAVYLIIPTILLIIYTIKKQFIKYRHIQVRKPKLEQSFDFAAIITAHKDVALLPPLVDSLLKQSYNNFLIYLVADACDMQEIRFNDPRIVVLKPEIDLNSKIKSIDYACNNFQRPHDALVIFDSDNLAHPALMQTLNLYFKQGFRAVQSNLQPKNTDSLYSRMDAIGDAYYNFTEREARMELGISSAIWGLGIAIETNLYKEIIYQNFLGGFDKRIQADLVMKIPRIAFAKEAIVYDEKIADGGALETQRTRWINAYFKYLSLSWTVFLHGFKTANFNRIFFGFINLRPPLFLVCGFAFLFFVLNLLLNPLMATAWAGIAVLFVLTFIAIITSNVADKKVVNTLFYMPLFAFRQLLALFKIKRANKTFLKTEHTKLIYIDDLLKHESI